jgi:hypothetical protein
MGSDTVIIDYRDVMLWHKESVWLRLLIIVRLMLYCVANITKIQRTPDLVLCGAKAVFAVLT